VYASGVLKDAKVPKLGFGCQHLDSILHAVVHRLQLTNQPAYSSYDFKYDPKRNRPEQIVGFALIWDTQNSYWLVRYFVILVGPMDGCFEPTPQPVLRGLGMTRGTHANWRTSTVQLELYISILKKWLVKFGRWVLLGVHFAPKSWRKVGCSVVVGPGLPCTRTPFRSMYTHLDFTEEQSMRRVAAGVRVGCAGRVVVWASE
jgi:hypothetical protein